MDYSEFREALLKKLMEQNTPNNSSPLTQERAEACLFRLFSSFPKYVNAVLKHDYFLNSPAKFTMDTEEFQWRAEELDLKRRNLHKLAVASLDQLNSLCFHYNVENIYNVDTGDKYAVGDFCAKFTAKLNGEKNITTLEEILNEHHGISYSYNIGIG